jgi:hypothetical protein
VHKNYLEKSCPKAESVNSQRVLSFMKLIDTDCNCTLIETLFFSIEIRAKAITFAFIIVSPVTVGEHPLFGGGEGGGVGGPKKGGGGVSSVLRAQSARKMSALNEQCINGMLP